MKFVTLLLYYSSEVLEFMTGCLGNISGGPNSSLKPVICVIKMKMVAYFV